MILLINAPYIYYAGEKVLINEPRYK